MAFEKWEIKILVTGKVFKVFINLTWTSVGNDKVLIVAIVIDDAFK
jgi:hypothetical protein